MKKFVLIFAIFIFQSGFSQQTDFLKIRKYRIAFLDDQIRETSGLNFFNGKLYTFNDSGNTPELFEIDKTSGKILNVLKINAKNNDWEALTNDGKNFYIGDFGNNTGTRKDLTIYKVPFPNDSLKNHQVAAISFYYPEQTEFVSKNTRNNFDAEAMIYLNGKLHIFTKEWAAKATSHYIIDPEVSENQKAEKIEAYNTNFVVTDASYFDQKLYLIGYTKKTEVFLDIFKETEPGIFFQETPKHYYLGSAMSIGQIEGIAVDEKGLYISGEKFKHPLGVVKQSLYFIPKEQLKD
ncbi:hypothetical protein IQ37_14580 [Chryseobacterium piperi]|uniref:Uncharacterized protein n=1 Tax=Chryseobacterium piperi TaxID=558152 RepID=A0A086B2G9_9FLAO|nr:hypothetical protein [Chryseobacterium piperi]ASW73061.1 hypothetical protein CJF12_01320 [Chryseobacterium piperi]KFF23133.1 hypothetical protein IQ37_14580 [Chryseobacterium piperi]